MVAVVVIIVIMVGFLFIVVLQALTEHCILLTAAKAAHPKLDYTIKGKIFTDGIMHVYENIKHQ